MQDLTDASGRKAAADILAALLRSPDTFGSGAVGGGDARWGEALAELTAKVRERKAAVDEAMVGGSGLCPRNREHILDLPLVMAMI